MKNKLFLCFRPMVIETEDSVLNDIHHSKFSTEIAVGKGRKGEVSLINSSRSAGTGHNQRKRSFSGVLKAVLFQISLRKSVRDRYVRELTFQSEGIDSTNRDSVSGQGDDKSRNPQIFVTGSVFSSSCSSSCSSSKSGSKKFTSQWSEKGMCSSRYDSFNRKKQSSGNCKIGADCSVPNSGLLLLIFTIFATVFWGKVFAILCTSMWLYFAPRLRNTSGRRLENMVNPAETTELSKSSRKRAIMEGILERNHHHHHGGGGGEH